MDKPIINNDSEESFNEEELLTIIDAVNEFLYEDEFKKLKNSIIEKIQKFRKG